MDTLRFPIRRIDGSFSYVDVRVGVTLIYYNWELDKHCGDIMYECPCGLRTAKPYVKPLVISSTDEMERRMEIYRAYFKAELI